MSDELPRIYVTYEEAAKMLAYKSTRSVQRKVAAGELEARGKGKGKRVLYTSVLGHPDYGRAN